MFWNRDAYDYAAYADPAGMASGHWLKALGYAVAMAMGGAVIVPIIVSPAPPPLTEGLCPVGAVPATHVVVLVDKTDLYSPDQQHALESSLREHMRALRLGERLTLYQVTPGGSTMVRRLYDRCRPKTGAEADPVKENPKFVERTYQTQFVQPFEQSLAALTEPEPSDYTPLIEALYAIAHDAPLADKTSRRMVEIWSDMLAKSEIIDMYRPGYTFEQLLRADSLYLEVPSLRGSEVRIFQLANRYPKHQNGDHARFWDKYFRHAGVAENQLAMRRL